MLHCMFTHTPQGCIQVDFHAHIYMCMFPFVSTILLGPNYFNMVEAACLLSCSLTKSVKKCVNVDTLVRASVYLL